MSQKRLSISKRQCDRMIKLAAGEDKEFVKASVMVIKWDRSLTTKLFYG